MTENYARRRYMTRVKARIRLAILMLLGAALLSGCAGSSLIPSGTSASGTATSDFFAMNTYMTITVNGTEAKAAASAAVKAVNDLEQSLSRNIASSEISAINAKAGVSPVTVSGETYGLIKSAVEYSVLTDGVFDITIAPVMDIWGFSDGNYRVPAQSEIDAALGHVDCRKIILDDAGLSVFLPEAGMAIDLGGIAKGCASDVVQKVIKSYDVSSAMISLGGNVAVFGTKADGSLFRTAITDPRNPDRYIGILEATGVSVITSGGYERFFTENGVTYIHIMDPLTGSPVKSDLLSVTIITPDGTEGDALSTALFVMGRDKAVEFGRTHTDFSFVLVTETGELVVSSALKDSFTPTDSSAAVTYVD